MYMYKYVPLSENKVSYVFTFKVFLLRSTSQGIFTKLVNQH